LIYWHFWEI